MTKKIKYLLLLSFMILLGLCNKSEARITTNDPTVNSEGTVTITVNSQEKVASGAINVSSNGGLTFVSASGGQVNGTLVAFAGTDNKTSGIATYTFKAPKVTETKTFKVVFASQDMANADGDEVASSSATASVTVKAASSGNNNDSNSSSGNNNGNSSSGGNNTTTNTAPTFTSVNETVYATSDDINVRASYSTSSSVLRILKKGESLTRIGVGSNGWSKVTYDGKTAYISTNLLTKTKPAETTDKKEDDDNKTDETKSSNKNLKSLTTTPSTLSPKFSASTTEYAMTIGNDVNEIEIDAVAEDEKAKVSIEGNTDLKIGENTIKIKVTAEDGTVRTYKIAVTKEGKNQVGLKELLIEGVTLKPEFDSSVYQYTIDLENSDISELNITATANKEKATVEIIGNTNLEVGSNIITILVTLSDDETATYQIVVNIPKPVVTENKNDNMELYKRIGIGVVGAIVLIAIIVVVAKMRKNDDDEDEELDDEPERKYYEEEKNEKEKTDDKYEERSKKIDELYTMDDDLAMGRRRGKHF